MAKRAFHELASVGDPQRLALANAITAMTEARRQSDASKAAIARAERMVRQAQAKVDEAGERVTKAKADETARRVSALSTGETLTVDNSLRDARTKEIETIDELDNAKAALAQVEASAGDPQYQLQRAETHLKECIRPIMAAAIDTVIDDMNALVVKMTDNWAILLFLRQFEQWSPIPKGSDRKIEAFLNSIEWGFRQWNTGQVKKDTATDPWEKAFDALHHDADTKLPLERSA